MEIEKPLSFLAPLIVKRKTLMGPGPSNASPRVLQALSQPVLGHFHQETFQLMDEIKSGLQYVFQTRNKLTLAVSATGHGGMEAAMCNLIEPGDVALIAVKGIWGKRAADMASRYGGNVKLIETAPGQNFTLSEIEEGIKKHRPVVFFITQGESSTGVFQPIEGIGGICKKYDCLLIVDTVASLGGVETYTDKWGIDCIYTGSQKVLGAPPGLAPISFSPKAVKKIQNRKHPICVFYFDMNWLGQYWDCFEGEPRVYHHTISTTLLYGLREGIAQIVEEGLDNCIKRHKEAAKILHEGLIEAGLEFYVANPNARLPTVTTIKVNINMDWKAITQHCLNKCDVEISGGLGPTVGKVLRIGVMGYNADTQRVHLTLKTLKQALQLHSKSKL